MWYHQSVLYQIYPFGFCGAPEKNDGVLVPRIKKVLDFIPHLVKLNIDAVYFCPVFESSAHGYDTADYSKIDVRLGSNQDFKEVADALHQHGIRVILDGVFNHVGRDFFAFRDVKEKRWDSPYKDWFCLNFDGNSNYDDGFWYEGWEGHFELVKLNLNHPEVRKYLLERVGDWMEEFRIDGLRLDVAYMLNHQFMKELRSFCLAKNPEFFLVGEMIHGDYKSIMNDEMLHSATNYECFKGIYSSFNSMNMFEIGYSLNRQFGKEDWCLYRGAHLVSFVDNHDVSRIATNLTNKNHIIPAFGLLMAMPGIPTIYYGSEWGMEGDKQDGDGALRPCVDMPLENEVTAFLQKAIKIHREKKCLHSGSLEILHTTNKQLVFERACEGERMIVLINADEEEYIAHFNANAGCGTELLSGEAFDFGGGSKMPPCSVQYVEVCL